MKIKLKNFQLVPAINFLSDISLNGKASRARMKLITKLNSKREEMAEEIKLIDHSQGSAQYDTEATEILYETTIIDLTEYANKMRTLADALENYEGELSGKNAGAHDLLLDEFEANGCINEAQDKEENQLQEAE